MKFIAFTLIALAAALSIHATKPSEVPGTQLACSTNDNCFLPEGTQLACQGSDCAIPEGIQPFGGCDDRGCKMPSELFQLACTEQPCRMPSEVPGIQLACQVNDNCFIPGNDA